MVVNLSKSSLLCTRSSSTGIKFHPNKPGSPHLNGKVERSQKTDKSEFYPTIDVSVGLEELDLLLAEWQHYYNWERPRSSLKGLTPIDRITETSDQTPLSEEVSQHYQIRKERFQEQNYKLDLQLRKLKPSL